MNSHNAIALNSNKKFGSDWEPLRAILVFDQAIMPDQI